MTGYTPLVPVEMDLWKVSKKAELLLEKAGLQLSAAPHTVSTHRLSACVEPPGLGCTVPSGKATADISTQSLLILMGMAHSRWANTEWDLNPSIPFPRLPLLCSPLLSQVAVFSDHRVLEDKHQQHCVLSSWDVICVHRWTQTLRCAYRIPVSRPYLPQKVTEQAFSSGSLVD